MIASLNVNSLQLHLDEIKCLVNEKGIHILAVNETKLDNEKSPTTCSRSRATLHREDRNRNGGGVVVYVRNSLKHNRKTYILDKSIEFVCIEIEPISLALSYIRLVPTSICPYSVLQNTGRKFGIFR